MRNLSGIVDNKDIVTKDYIPTKTSDLSNDSGFITGMTILSYGSSTWADFEAAYNAKKVVYCRASSNSNPASGSQTRLAFMAYVNNADNPTNVEFQYYRSVSSHTASQQGDQVFVYKLDKTAGWTVTTREASVEIDINNNNEGIETTYSNGVVTIGHANSITAQTTQAVYPIAYDAQGHITSGGAAVTVPTQASDIGAIASSEKGAASGVVPLDSNSLIDEQYLPSYVDDVIEGYYYEGSFYEDSAHTTSITGETGKIYIDLTGSKSYRWSGTVFVEITSGGHTYTAGNGIDISAGDVISIDTDDVQEKLVSGTNIKTINNTSLLGNGNLSIEGVPHVDLTQAQYDALTPAEKNNGTIYFITDGSSGGSGTVTSVGISNTIDGGLSISGSPITSSGIISVGHSNVLSSAQTTLGVYPIKIDKNGHISEYGSAVSIPTQASDIGAQPTLVSGTNIKTINNESVLGSGNISISGGSKNIWYGTCNTAEGTAAKIVTTSSEDFVLTIGNMVRVKFSNGNTYNGTATLNVDGKGVVNITRIGTTTTTRYFWQAGEVVDFVYDGTNFVISQRGVGTTNYYGVTKLSDSTSSTSTTLAATANAVKTVYDLANGKQNQITYSTTDLTPGTSSLTTGDIYVVYE